MRVTRATKTAGPSDAVSQYQKKFLHQGVIPILKIVLTGNPKKIKKISDELLSTGKRREAVQRLFNYSGWFIEKKEERYTAYILAKNLDINTCVYCNRNYTSTVDKITRPQFDHYFSQEKYPLLALSFYNLIPSCAICNSAIKGEKELFLSEHLHPYINDCLDDFRFSYEYDTKMKDSLTVKLKYSKDRNKTKKIKKVKETFDFFKINEIYNAHTDELRDLIKIREAFSDKYLEILSKEILDGTNINRSELYQIAFGVYLNDDNISKRPFSKFKKDILTELGIIKGFTPSSTISFTVFDLSSCGSCSRSPTVKL